MEYNTMHTTCQEAIMFTIWEQRKRLNESTIKNRNALLHRYFKLFPKIDYPSCESFIDYLIKNNSKNSTLNHYIQVFKQYTIFSKEKGLEFDDKILTLKQYPQGDSIRPILTDEEINKIINLLPSPVSRNPYYDMWSDFMRICSLTGARPGEIAKLTPYNIDWQFKMFMLPPESTKTNTARYIPIHETLIPLIQKLVKDRKDKELLFTIRGKALNSPLWSYAFKERVERLGIKRPNISLYSFRHSFINSLLAQENINSFLVRDLAGHRSIQTTEKYYKFNFQRLHSTLKHLTLLKDKLSTTEKVNLLKDFIAGLKFNHLTIDEKKNKFKVEVDYV